MFNLLILVWLELGLLDLLDLLVGRLVLLCFNTHHALFAWFA